MKLGLRRVGKETEKKEQLKDRGEWLGKHPDLAVPEMGIGYYINVQFYYDLTKYLFQSQYL